MPEKKIAVVVGTRPEAVKMAPVVHALRTTPGVATRVLSTGQHREILDQILGFFEVKPDRDLDLMRRGQDLAGLTARMTTALDAAFAEEAPDVVLAQGDTTTVMVAALCAFYRGIRFGHVEAGLRTGNLRNPFPEEMNRVLTGRLAAVHFAPTEGSADNLRREGVDAASIHVTGNTVIDALLWTAERVDPEPYRAAGGRRLVLVTAHRRENFGAPFASICAALRLLADRDDIELLYPVHPNPAVREPAYSTLGDHPRIRLVDPLDYPAMVAAMRACDLILTDSGGVQEEAPTLGKPVLVLRETTERPEGVEAGAARLIGTETERIVSEAARLLDNPTAHGEMAAVQNPYGDGRAAQRIAELCAAD